MFLLAKFVPIMEIAPYLGLCSWLLPSSQSSSRKRSFVPTVAPIAGRLTHGSGGFRPAAKAQSPNVAGCVADPILRCSPFVSETSTSPSRSVSTTFMLDHMETNVRQVCPLTVAPTEYEAAFEPRLLIKNVGLSHRRPAGPGAAVPLKGLGVGP